MDPSEVKREKDERISQVIRGFFQAKVEFDHLLAEYHRSSVIDYSRLHTFLEGHAFDLKEECHVLFRSSDRSRDDEIRPEELFDVLISSVFHELMKIKECSYQIQQYEPTFKRMSKSPEGVLIKEHKDAFLKSCLKLVRRARNSIKTDLVSTSELFRDTCEHLERMIQSYQTNRVLVRMIVDERELVEKAIGEGGSERLLSSMFKGKLDQAYLAAANQYLSGGWYTKAQQVAERAKEIDPKNPDADAVLQLLETARAAHRA